MVGRILLIFDRLAIVMQSLMLYLARPSAVRGYQVVRLLFFHRHCCSPVFRSQASIAVDTWLQRPVGKLGTSPLQPNAFSFQLPEDVRDHQTINTHIPSFSASYAADRQRPPVGSCKRNVASETHECHQTCFDLGNNTKGLFTPPSPL